MLTLTNPKAFWKECAKAFIKISIAGVVIGLLHEHDFWVAVLLFLKIAKTFITKILKEKHWVLLVGMLLTGGLGVLAEHWGVSNRFWEYHDVPRNLPYWLPFAWMLAFSFLYKLETRTIPYLQQKSIKNKIILTTLFVLFFPAYGEVITINLGVWTYYWPYQFLGVPLYALICLAALHMGINWILYLVCKKYQIKDIVFTAAN